MNFVGGLFLPLTCQSQALDSFHVHIDSKAIIYAMDNIMDRFYSKQTSTVFMMEQSSLAVSRNLEPEGLVDELMRIRNNDDISMCYVLESHIERSIEIYKHRFFNIFVVDSYDSFR